VQSVIGPKGLKGNGQILDILLDVEVEFLPYSIEQNGFYAISILRDGYELLEETLRLAQIFNVPIEARHIGLFFLRWHERFD
jgi:hypothetical protein